jgi:hypothetical protein
VDGSKSPKQIEVAATEGIRAYANLTAVAP